MPQIAKLYSLIVVVFICFLLSCNTTSTESNTSHKKEIIKSKPGADTIEATYDDSLELAEYFVIVADTGTDYFVLQEKMLHLNKQTNIPIDTMGRYFDKLKNKIVLPEDDEDEIYAGDYFPRRFPSISFSLDYLDFYKQHAADKSIAIVSGIFEEETSADSTLNIIKRYEKNAFKLKSEIYIGCMH